MNSTTAGVETPKKPGFLINRNFALLWTGSLISIFGDFIFDFTLAIWIALYLAHGQTWAPLAVSAVLVAALTPAFLFGPIAGVFVDRWDKRRTMLVMDAIRAALIAILILATNIIPLPFLPGGRVPLAGQLVAIYSTVFLTNLFSQFFGPAKMSLIGDIVPDPQRAQAGGLSQGSQSVAFLLGPALAPVLAVKFGVEWALVINALSFVFSFLMIQAIRAPKAAQSVVAGQKGNVVNELVLGLRFAVRNRFISTLIVAGAVIMFGVAALNSLDLFFVITNLHASASLYGLLSTALGVGLIAGSIFAGGFAQRIGLVRTLNIALLMTGLSILIYARMTSFTPALILLGFAGFFQAALNVAVGPLIFRVTPRAMIGRVSAVINPTIALAQLVGTILAGYLASQVLPNFHQTLAGITFTTYDTIFTGGAVIAILGTIFAVLRLGFRDPQPLDEAPPMLAEAAVASDVRTAAE